MQKIGWDAFAKPDSSDSDLARERLCGDKAIDGIIFDRTQKNGLVLTRTKVHSESAAKKLGVCVGHYRTIEADIDFSLLPHQTKEEIIRLLSFYLNEFCRKLTGKKAKLTSVLLVGCGNRKITTDALGPRVIEQMEATAFPPIRRGARAEYAGHAITYLSAPGVCADTGYDIIAPVSGILQNHDIDWVIAVDALCAASCERIGRVIQITDAGILPGSGSARSHSALTEESLGIPVVAVGIPTVSRAGTFFREMIGAEPLSAVPHFMKLAPFVENYYIFPRNSLASVDCGIMLLSRALHAVLGTGDF